MLIAPRRTLRAWLASGQGHPNLFARDLSEYEAILSLTIAELRDQLGVSREGLAAERALHVAAPKDVDFPPARPRKAST